MEKREIPGRWQKQSGNSDELKHEFIVLSDNDPIFEEESEKGMYEDLQIKLGKTHLELHKIIAML